MKVDALLEDRGTGRRLIQTFVVRDIKQWLRIKPNIAKATKARVISWQITEK